MNYVADLLNLVVYVVTGLALMYAAKSAFDFRQKSVFSSDLEIQEKSNVAVGFQRGGLYLGLAIALYGVSSGHALTFDSYGTFLLDGVVALLFFLVATYVNDKLILPGIDNTQELAKDNGAVGLVEAGSLIATGIILKGLFSGEGDWLTAIVFFALSQLALVLCAHLYYATARYNAQSEIANGNSASGIMIGSLLIAFGLIVSRAVAGNFTDWNTSLAGFAFTGVVGFVLLLVATWLIDLLFLPNTDLKTEVERDKNEAAIWLTGAIRLACAVIIIMVLR